MTVGIEPAQRHVLRQPADRRLRDQSDDLSRHRPRPGLGRQVADALDHRRERDGDRVVDVGRDLRDAVEVHADSAHAGKPAARLPQPGRHGTGDLGVAGVELDVERGQRPPGRDERGAGAGMRLARARGRVAARRRPSAPPAPPGHRGGRTRARAARARSRVRRRGTRARRARRSRPPSPAPARGRRPGRRLTGTRAGRHRALRRMDGHPGGAACRCARRRRGPRRRAPRAARRPHPRASARCGCARRRCAGRAEPLGQTRRRSPRSPRNSAPRRCWEPQPPRSPSYRRARELSPLPPVPGHRWPGPRPRASRCRRRRSGDGH